MKKYIKTIISFLVLCLIALAVFKPMCCSYIFPWELGSITQRAQNSDINAFYHLYNYHKNWLQNDNNEMVLFLSKYINQYSRYCNEFGERLISYNMPNKREILKQYKSHCTKYTNKNNSIVDMQQ